VLIRPKQSQFESQAFYPSPQTARCRALRTFPAGAHRGARLRRRGESSSSLPLPFSLTSSAWSRATPLLLWRAAPLARLLHAVRSWHAACGPRARCARPWRGRPPARRGQLPARPPLPARSGSAPTRRGQPPAPPCFLRAACPRRDPSPARGVARSRHVNAALRALVLARCTRLARLTLFLLLILLFT
jgi:hypothetical protein